MQERERDADQVVISVTLDELRLLLGILNEALNGPYAVPADEWVDLVGQPPSRVAALISEIGAIVER